MHYILEIHDSHCQGRTKTVDPLAVIEFGSPLMIPYLPPSRVFLFGSAAGVIVLHFSLWAATSSQEGLKWGQFLNHWDSAWYDSIIQNGYEEARFAFYPLYPLLVKVIATSVGHLKNSALAGAIFSTLLFFGFVATTMHLSRLSDSRLRGLYPENHFSWLLLILSPASYVFFSHHTESLFLLLSLLAFQYGARGRWLPASIFAGLCALTKNQGIFVAITVGLWTSFSSNERNPFRNFALSGLVSGSLFALYPLYQWMTIGEPFAFVKTQYTWRPEMNLASYVKTLGFGNPWQNTNTSSIARYLFFWMLVVTLPFLWRKNRWLALYCVLIVGIMPISGEFIATFRYASMLFPIWYLWGEKLYTLPSPIRIAAAVGALALNLHIARNYCLGNWAY